MPTFTFQHFSCHADVYTAGKDLVVRFYDASKEQTEAQIVNCVIVDPGYGYISLKFKGEDALLSGYLDERVFTDEMIHVAIDFVEQLSPHSSAAYIPHHVRKVAFTGYIEYNGEY